MYSDSKEATTLLFPSLNRLMKSSSSISTAGYDHGVEGVLETRNQATLRRISVYQSSVCSFSNVKGGQSLIFANGQHPAGAPEVEQTGNDDLLFPHFSPPAF